MLRKKSLSLLEDQFNAAHQQSAGEESKCKRPAEPLDT
jgi:hypothetical protein